LILASASSHRALLLANAGVEFDVEPARIDERQVELSLAGADPARIAAVLARAKALEVSGRLPSRPVIGCDQMLSLDAKVLHKPADMTAARDRLLQLSGRDHVLDSAVCLVFDGKTLWEHVERATIRFRSLDAGFVDRHLAAVGKTALSSVGAYQIEGRGIQLIEHVDGDFFSIVGLPLLPLLARLRQLGILDA
jgi:septum formation protein